MSTLEVRNVSKSFGATLAVDDVSLSMHDGEFFGLLGPSGCGKTTMLRIIAGLEAPDRGAVLIDGIDVSSLPANRRPVNTVFQSYALFPRMRVIDNVMYGLRSSGVGRDEARQRAGEALDMVRLSDRARSRPSELSGGQQQRVALARALVNRPKILLLDEPLSALDLHLRSEMQDELIRLHALTGCTFVIVTHDQHEAFALCDRVAVMVDGRLRQLGMPDELYDAPIGKDVAQFVGFTNLIDAVRSHNCVTLADGTQLDDTIVADENRATSLAAGEVHQSLGDAKREQHGHVSIRPEHLSMVDRGHFTGSIDHIAFLGATARINVTTSGQLTLAVNVEPSAARQLRIGDVVQLAVQRARFVQ
jgi:ABC-type Fe3+/spermidine/putrescine transport system ATPase subunit